jgi:hypothetical protein
MIYHEDYEDDTFIANRIIRLLSKYHKTDNKKLTVYCYDAGNTMEAFESMKDSRYLLVICSLHTKNSVNLNDVLKKWQSHADKEAVNSILTILIDGDPKDAFPFSLRFVPYRYIDNATGKIIEKEIEIEPLAADIRSRSKRRTMKLLKTEILRIIAPLTDTTFDKLYKISNRRRTINIQKTFLSLLLFVSVFAALITGTNKFNSKKTDYYNNLNKTNSVNKILYRQQSEKVNLILDKLKADILTQYKNAADQKILKNQFEVYETKLYPRNGEPGNYIQEIVEQNDIWNTSLIGENTGTLSDAIISFVRFSVFFMLPILCAGFFGIMILIGLMWFLYQTILFYVHNITNKMTFQNWNENVKNNYPKVLKKSFLTGLENLKKLLPLLKILLRFMLVAYSIILFICVFYMIFFW